LRGESALKLLVHVRKMEVEERTRPGYSTDDTVVASTDPAFAAQFDKALTAGGPESTATSRASSATRKASAADLSLMSSKARGGSATLSRSLPVDGESAKPVGGAAAKLFGGASAKLRQAVAAVRAEASGDMWKQAIVSVQPEVAAALAAKEAAKNYGNVAFDMSGRPHDIADLRERRNAAIVKGLKMMHKFFKKKNFEALHEVGDDAPSIFFECWYTSANSSIRMQSKAICKQLMPKYELGWPRIANEGLGWPLNASDRLGWPLIASERLGSPH